MRQVRASGALGGRIGRHIRPDPIHGLGKTLATALEPREQSLVIDSISPQGRKLDLASLAVCARFGEEIFDHTGSIGEQSYTFKDKNPMADGVGKWEPNPMTDRDPFVIGLMAILAARPDVKPAPLGVAAGLDNSTIRKLLNGQITSMKVDSAQKIAAELGISLSTIIALGEHSRGPDVVRLALAIEEAGDDERARIDGYLRVAGQSKPQEPEIVHPTREAG